MLNDEYKFSKCSDDCEGDDSYNNVEYKIKCSGLDGEDCHTANGCDALRNLTCGDTFNNKTLVYSNAPKCINKDGCNKATEG